MINISGYIENYFTIRGHQILALCLIMAIILASYPQGTNAAVSRVQSATGSNGGATTVAVSLSGAPADGNTLIAVIGTRGSTSGRVSSVTQTGATWTKAVESINASGVTSEIWYASNVSGAATSITINLAASLKASAIIAEYSGILTSGIVDKTATSTGNSFSPSSGTTETTSQADELWVGGIANINTYTYALETNGFSEVAESASTGQGAASRNNTVFEEKIVSATGAASVGASLALPGGEWAGAIATFKAVPSTAAYTQASYRWFDNNNSTDVGSAFSSSDTFGVAPPQGVPFRLRMLIHVGSAGLSVNGQNFKLQVAEKVGSCDTVFSGENYADVSASSGVIRFYDNASPADDVALTSNASDPIHGGDTITNQTYEEANNFTNSQSAIPADQDGKWDFSLIDYSAPRSTFYCFRIVKSDDTPLDSYSVIPEIIMANSVGGAPGGGGGGGIENPGSGTPQGGGESGGSGGTENPGSGDPQGGGEPGGGGGIE